MTSSCVTLDYSPQKHPAEIDPLRVSLAPRTVLSIKSDATRVGRCARGSAHTGFPSSSLEL